MPRNMRADVEPDVERDHVAAIAAARQAFTDLQAAIGPPLVETVAEYKDENHDR